MSEASKSLTGLNADNASDVDTWHLHPCDVIEKLDLDSRYELKGNITFSLYNFGHKGMRRI